MADYINPTLTADNAQNAGNPYGFQMGRPGMGGAPAAPPPMDPTAQMQSMALTPLGHPSFAINRARPGQAPPSGVNPLTGQPYRNYQEFMAVAAPQAYMATQAPQTRPFMAMAQQAAPFFNGR